MYGILYGSVAPRIGAGLVFSLIVIVYPVLKFIHLFEIARKVDYNLPVDQPSLSTSTHLSGGLLRFDSFWSIFWPLLHHYMKVTMAIVVVTLIDPFTASGVILLLKIVELIFFVIVWPFEARFKFDLDNRAQCIAQVFITLAFGCLFLSNLHVGDGDRTALTDLFQILGISAAFVVPLIALVMKLCGSRIEHGIEVYGCCGD